ncbi:UDP-N-acetylmuramoylalanine--D-glutamate ligase [Gossypium australe]|uniref:UDP-N-acetylmuramoylalanine--D-glutamate ligase n=1 Tax=Gossypium australe TaxID=47621 RepID=A0A5B6VND0_9ROSI|nr:UDP-N-acetylmuramoylalanine--D-glutamate ligase [Gossypium australe]
MLSATVLSSSFACWLGFAGVRRVEGDKVYSFNLLYCNFREIRLDIFSLLHCNFREIRLRDKIGYLQSAPLQLQGDKSRNFNLPHYNFRGIREMRFVDSPILLHCPLGDMTRGIDFMGLCLCQMIRMS